MNTLVAPLVIILSTLLAQTRTSINIIGQWEDAQAHEAAHRRIQFYRKGSFVTTIGIYFQGTYEVRGNDLLVKSTDSDSPVPERLSFTLEGDILTLSANSEEMKLRRSSRIQPGDLPFVARWAEKGAYFHGGNNGSCEVELTGDGRIRFKLEREPERGRYKIKGKLLTIDGESHRVHFEEGLLILKPLAGLSLSGNTDEMKYKRVRKDR